MSRTLALINARGGSKGVPRKNIRLLCGKPLISYSIEVALNTKSVDRVVVSTEDAEIAEIAKQAGADIPFMRPLELASDTALQMETILYTIKRLQDDGDLYGRIVLLQPTAPLRAVADVENAIALQKRTKAHCVISVTDVAGKHPATLYQMCDNNKLVPYVSIDTAGINRQDLDLLYWRTGGIYVIETKSLLETGTLYGKDVRGLVVDERTTFNIDSLFDWELTEAWIERKQATKRQFQEIKVEG